MNTFKSDEIPLLYLNLMLVNFLYLICIKVSLFIYSFLQYHSIKQFPTRNHNLWPVGQNETRTKKFVFWLDEGRIPWWKERDARIYTSEA